MAAGICLALSFTTDVKDRHNALLAEQGERSTVAVTAVADDNRAESSSWAEQRSRDAARHRPGQLFPWIPGLRLGGG
ncbi:MAG: hypothetical protein EA419_04605 [Wenzhouxiangella sp.]|nr:MAG: hypothetical protein EA419_04605 [Wenzhouxiangella sp.]